MSQPLEDDLNKRRWAEARFRRFFLGQLDLDEAERVAVAAALIPGLSLDMGAAEEELIEQYLDHRLPPDENTAFEAQYLNGWDPDNRAKLRMRQAVRSPQVQQVLHPAKIRPSPLRRQPILGWRTVALAASIVAVIFATLYVVDSHRFDSLLAMFRGRGASGPQKSNLEQPAGLTASGGLILPAASGGLNLRLGKAPQSLAWIVPDYQRQYRLRIDAASGQEIVSEPLTPKDNAIEYSPPNVSALALPWDIFVLGPVGAGQKILAHYTLNP
ncbi:MAG TPA: hypothetical protein VKU01_34585 [Bryobacteraceae bacterium]|nr:hypothetical protein [Bryobacteraceae bacterium]